MYIRCIVKREKNGDPGEIISMEEANAEQAKAVCERFAFAAREIEAARRKQMKEDQACT